MNPAEMVRLLREALQKEARREAQRILAICREVSLQQEARREPEKKHRPVFNLPGNNTSH